LPVPGQPLGVYHIVGEIAHGGMATVYLARKRFEIGGLAKLVAVKVLMPHLRDPEFVHMFLDEARVSVSITHPNVVQVLDVAQSDGYPYIVMEYLRGQPFGKVTRRATPDDDALKLQVLAQAAAGLHAAHETLADDGHLLGIVHRDVTPQNIFVGYDGCVKIVDFGIAASRGRMTTTRPEVLKGTLQYLAPEQINRARTIDRRADAWALGVIAWEVFAKESLFNGANEAETLWNVLNKQPPPIRELAPSVSPDVASVIMRCLARDPSQRPRDLREVEAAFARGAQHGQMPTQRELSDRMKELFAVERAADDERDAAIVEFADSIDPQHPVDERPDIPERAETMDQETFAREAVPVTRRRRVGGVVAALAALASAGAVGVMIVSAEHDAPAVAAPAAEMPPAETPAAAPAEMAPAETGSAEAPAETASAETPPANTPAAVEAPPPAEPAKVETPPAKHAKPRATAKAKSKRRRPRAPEPATPKTATPTPTPPPPPPASDEPLLGNPYK
jgi:serine/threonine-protein kinase